MTTTRPTGDGSRPAAAVRRHTRTTAIAVAMTVTLSGALSGCTGDRPDRRPGASGSQPPGVDELARQTAAQDAGDLLLLARRGAASTPALAQVYDRVVAVHRAHLAALGAAEPAAGSGAAAGSATGSAAGSTAASAGAPVRPQEMLAAEWAAARRALGASRTAGPAMATLLVRIAAARAVDADLLARAAKLPVPGTLQAPPAVDAGPATGSATTGTAPGTPTAAASGGAASGGAASGDPSGNASGSVSGSPGAATRSAGSRQALNDLLLGEHAATFAYGLLAARASAGQQALAQGLWQDHLVARDLLESRIVAVGDSPPVPAPAYDVGPPPGSPQQVAALAGRVERSLASVASTAVATADPDIRPLAAGYLVSAARRAARWGAVDPLPGEPAPPAAATASTTG